MNSLYEYDITAAQGTLRVAGVDEVGRGPLAGPVVAAAVILDLSSPIDGINDSKKLKPKRRDELYEKIIASGCVYGVGIVSPEEIDKINILQATFRAMKRALEKLEVFFDLLLVDGNQLIAGVDKNLQKTVVGGDAASANIAAASIVAKVTRDRIMEELHEQYPVYDFGGNKGYGTERHRTAITEHGLSPVHRKTFCGNGAIQMDLFHRGVK
ncbi:MAG: ribonuclease HII [Chitinispirillales bacterium]|jgi:ribonuclease HII|nr:ribonuclease HII [Chitinispirillales bacterium]